MWSNKLPIASAYVPPKFGLFQAKRRRTTARQVRVADLEYSELIEMLWDDLPVKPHKRLREGPQTPSFAVARQREGEQVSRWP